MKNGAAIFGLLLQRLLSGFGLFGLLMGLCWGQAAPIPVSAGFNLLGNSSSDPVAVTTVFGNATLYQSVWKWDASNNKWAFYSPQLADGGLVYGQSKGYEALTQINAGEGFWVNVKQAGSISFLNGTPVSSSSFNGVLKNGFNLISTGDTRTPPQFKDTLNTATPPSPGVAVQTLTTLWAWDPVQMSWYFYAPSLDQAGTLAGYIKSKNYLDFGVLGKTLGSGAGFWVNVGANTSVNTTPPNMASGVISGFLGGLVVNGQAFPDGRAGYDLLEDHADADPVSPGQAQLGQHVMLDYDAIGNAIAVHIFPALIGPVDAVPPTTAANRISVNGIPVQINTDASLGLVTIFGGYTGITDIKVGDRVEVHGVRQTDATDKAYVAATRIELRPTICNPSPCAVRVSGNISQLDAASFTLDGLTVHYAASHILPAGAQLAVGEWVSVLGNAAPVGGVLTAAAVKVRRLTSTSTNLFVNGPISNFHSSANFVVNGITIDAGALAPAGLANGQQVSIQGIFNPVSNTLVAATLSVIKPSVAAVGGIIINFVSPANFMVRNVLIDATNATFTGGSTADLMNNAAIEVHGALSGGKLIATTVAFRPMPQDVMQIHLGQIANYVAAASTFDLTLPGGGTLHAILANPEFHGGTLADFANGGNVLVTGSVANSVLTVHGVQFLLGPLMLQNAERSGLASAVLGMIGDHGMELGGIARNVQAANGVVTFMLNGLSVSYTGALPGLASGMSVQVSGTLSGLNFTASQVKL